MVCWPVTWSDVARMIYDWAKWWSVVCFQNPNLYFITYYTGSDAGVFLKKNKNKKQKTKMCHEQVLLTPPCLMGFSLHQCIIHGSLVRHSWEPHVNPARTSMGTLHVHVHGNLTPHHYLAPLAIFLRWAFFSSIFFPPGSLCVGHLGFLSPHWVGTMNTSPPSPHTNK